MARATPLSWEFTLGPVALRPHLTVGLPFETAWLFVFATAGCFAFHVSPCGALVVVAILLQGGILTAASRRDVCAYGKC